jgi:2OG-Fe(II) oxygenase superfamily
MNIKNLEIVSDVYKDLQKIARDYAPKYLEAQPFPHTTFDGFFSGSYLSKVSAEFPDLARSEDVIHHNNGITDIKLASARGDSLFGPNTKALMAFLNSHQFLDFLQVLTSIKEPLIPDPHFIGGGLHEIKPGGFLKVHADFNKHHETGLDRRVNILIYLNENWQESYGGHFELWNEDMTEWKKRELPIFNRMVIFNTTDFSYHGHPEPLNCPSNRSRKSLALYYYSNGRPSSEILNPVNYASLYKQRPGEKFNWKLSLKNFLRELAPPFLIKTLRRAK